VNRLDLLPRELLFIIFEFVRLPYIKLGYYRSVAQPLALMPFSKSLQPWQQTNLYHTVKIKSISQLVKFHGSLTSTSQQSIRDSVERNGPSLVLGDLIQHLDLEICPNGPGWETTDEGLAVNSVMEELSDVIGPQLRSIKNRQSTSSKTNQVGDAWLKRIAKFHRLETVKLSTSSGLNYMELLKVKSLKDLTLVLNSSIPARETRQLRNKSNQRQLSLDKLSLDGFFSLRVFEFLKATQATQITLSAKDKCDTITPALLALDPSSATHLDISVYASPYNYIIILDLQLQQFSQLQHLSLSLIKFTTSPQFFNGLFKNSPQLNSLTLGEGFDLIAQDLIDALKSLPHTTSLRKITLDHLNEDDEEYTPEEVDEDDPFPPRCNMNHLDDLIQLTKAKEIELSGSTLDALDYYRYSMEDLRMADDWRGSISGFGGHRVRIM
jgi:hypothetical protein